MKSDNGSKVVLQAKVASGAVGKRVKADGGKHAAVLLVGKSIKTIDRKTVERKRKLVRADHEHTAVPPSVELVDVEIASGVAEIDSRAFEGCVNIRSVCIPSSVKVVGDHAFERCVRLEKIEFRSENTKIGTDSFRWCVSLREVIVPDGMRKNARLSHNPEFVRIRRIEERNALSPKDALLRVGYVRMWGTVYESEKSYVDDLEKLDEELVNDMSCGELEGLYANDVQVEFQVDGTPIEFDDVGSLIKSGNRAYYSGHVDCNVWNKTGVYKVDMSRTDAPFWGFFVIPGEFDRDHLEVTYRMLLVGADFDFDPVLDRLVYNGTEIDVECSNALGSKDCIELVFDKGCMVTYDHGSGIKRCSKQIERQETICADAVPEILREDSWVHFVSWKKWSDFGWLTYEKTLRQHPEMKAFFVQWYGCAMDSGWDPNEAFLSHAVTRSPVWAFLLLSWDWMVVLETVPELIDNPELMHQFINMCDEGGESNGFYTEDDDRFSLDMLSDIRGEWEGREDMVNQWAYALILWPQLKSKCTVYGKFAGFSRCCLLAARPEFSEIFSLVELADRRSACWTDAESYESGWNLLVAAQPQFSKWKTS